MSDITLAREKIEVGFEKIRLDITSSGKASAFETTIGVALKFDF